MMWDDEGRPLTLKWDHEGQCGTMWDNVGQCGMMWDDYSLDVGRCGTITR